MPANEIHQALVTLLSVSDEELDREFQRNVASVSLILQKIRRFLASQSAAASSPPASQSPSSASETTAAASSRPSSPPASLSTLTESETTAAVSSRPSSPLASQSPSSASKKNAARPSSPPASQSSSFESETTAAASSQSPSSASETTAAASSQSPSSASEATAAASSPPASQSPSPPTEATNTESLSVLLRPSVLNALSQLCKNNYTPAKNTTYSKLLQWLEKNYGKIKEYLDQQAKSPISGGPEWQREHPYVVDVEIGWGRAGGPCRGSTSQVQDPSKLETLLAQRILALAFCEWEYKTFKTSRVEQLLENPAATGAHGNIQTYLRAQPGIINKDTASKAIQCGIKLLVVEELAKDVHKLKQIGEDGGFDATTTTAEIQMSGLSAVLALTPSLCWRMTYLEAPCFVVAFLLPRYEKIFNLARIKSPWFRNYEELYRRSRLAVREFVDPLTTLHHLSVPLKRYSYFPLPSAKRHRQPSPAMAREHQTQAPCAATLLRQLQIHTGIEGRELEVQDLEPAGGGGDRPCRSIADVSAPQSCATTNTGATGASVQGDDFGGNMEGQVETLEHLSNFPLFGDGDAMTFSPWDASRAPQFEMQMDQASETLQPANEELYTNFPPFDSGDAFIFSPWDASRATYFGVQTNGGNGAGQESVCAGGAVFLRDMI